ncbi:MAG: electron transfer flavoprotein-ubiquinone oxidoreductase [Candidatus Obscuribacterales bacterium]|nr:electron transfer flavoprotein-ubiquinone oxidoreductase [Candidatus Obscuribacterales bacterium]
MSTRIEYDVLLVGGSPSNLTLAYHLLDLAKASGKELSICILEKGKEFGSHVMSGAVSNPHVLQKIWPNYKEIGFPIEATCTESNFSVLGTNKKWDMPSFAYPKSLDKTGYLVLTLSYVTGWMAMQVQEKAKEVPNVTVDLFTGFAAHKVVFEDGRVAGVAVTENPKSEEDYVYGKFTTFGDKGFISRDVIDHYKLRDCPQIWSVGVKEVWQCNESYEGKVWHTLGWPLLDGTFGGGFVYGMKDNKITIGMVISLDSHDPNMNPQQKLQEYKKHPWIQSMIKGGKLLKYGAALLPEGGYYSLPKKFAVPGALLLGDALGVLDVKHLAGIDRSMECGYVAAEVLHDALVKGDLSEEALAAYQQRLTDSFVIKESYNDRYFRWAFMENPRLLSDYVPTIAKSIDNSSPFMGMLQIGLKNPFRAIGDGIKSLSLIEGMKDIGPIKYKPDYQHIIPDYVTPKYDEPPYDKATIYSRPDAVFYASTKYHEGNQHIDEFNADVCVKCIGKYEGLGKTTPCVADCTAEVHRIDIIADVRRHGMSLENCVHCRTCEIVCPEVNLRVKPTEQGSGPDFMGL